MVEFQRHLCLQIAAQGPETANAAGAASAAGAATAAPGWAFVAGSGDESSVARGATATWLTPAPGAPRPLMKRRMMPSAAAYVSGFGTCSENRKAVPEGFSGDGTAAASRAESGGCMGSKLERATIGVVQPWYLKED